MRSALYILASLDDADIDWLVSAGRRRSLTKGEVLIEEHRPFDSMFIVLEGSLAVSVAAEPGKSLAHVGPGEVLGEISLLDSRPPLATVTATTQSQVVVIGKNRLASKLERDHGFAARFYRALAVFLAQRIRQSTAQWVPGKSVYDEDVEGPDEIDPALLDELSLAGKRFEWMINRLKQSPLYVAEPQRA